MSGPNYFESSNLANSGGFAAADTANLSERRCLFQTLTSELAATATELVSKHCCSEENNRPHPGVNGDQVS